MTQQLAQPAGNVVEEKFLRNVFSLCKHRGPDPDSIEEFDTEDKWIADLWRQARALLSAPVVKAEQLAAGQVPDALTFLQDNDLAASGDWQQGWNDCRSFFAAPVPSTVGQEWQPIETAPKALLPESGCAVSDYVLIAYDLFDGDEVYGKGISVGRLRRGGRGDATTEYWDSPSFDEIYEPPTHWMPLLAPPQAAPEQEVK